MGSAVEDMQVGCLWQGDYLITVSLSGFINYLDRSSGRLSRVVKVCLLKSCKFTALFDGLALPTDKLRCLLMWNWDSCQ